MIRHAAFVLAAAAMLGACETMPEFLNQPLNSSGSPSSPSTVEPASTPAPSYAQPPEQQLLELERQLSATAQQRGLGGALASVIDPGEGFVVRAGQLYEGPEQVAAGLGSNAAAGPIYWQVDRVEVASSGDMGMTSGRYVQVVTGSEAVQGRYVAVWRRNAGGDWKLLSESRIADPPRAAPARRR